MFKDIETIHQLLITYYYLSCTFYITNDKKANLPGVPQGLQVFIRTFSISKTYFQNLSKI